MKDPIEQRIFNCHRNIRQVIYNPRNQTHQAWIQAGVPLEEDVGSFREFLAWTLRRLGPAPSPASRLVRKDQRRGFLRRNLEWGTHRDQGDRLRSTVQIQYRGRRQCLQKWSRETGISYHLLYGRHRSGTLNLSQLIKEHCGKTSL